MQTVIITGGTGLVGTALAKMLNEKGYKVIIFSRSNKESNNPMLQYACWDVERKQIDENSIKEASYIVNLAGAGVMEKSWSDNYKKVILDSRVNSCQLLVQALSAISNKVEAVISASAIGWYPPSKNNSLAYTEEQVVAKNFLGNVCKEWEESIKPITSLQKRLCILRIGIVLSKNGGAFTAFIKPFKYKIAACMGKQMVSWIHIDDLCNMILFAIENKQVSGTYNAVAPTPLSNNNLVKTLAQKLIKGFYLPISVPSFIIKLLLGKRSLEVLKSANVSSEKIVKAGFTFKYSNIAALVSSL